MVRSADNINPDHYKSHAGGYQVIDIIEFFQLNFSRGNAVKYLLRAGRKAEEGYRGSEKEIEDLNKAKWYIEREIERINKNEPK